MAELIYILCALTSVLCAGLLYRSYRRTRVRLLLWSTICFLFLTVNNVLVFVDLILLPQTDLSLLRNGVALIGVGCLIFGFIWDTQQASENSP
jgi:hypothetical protein